MGFRIRGSDSILQRLTVWVSSGTEKLTDFNPGSAIRTLLESVALQIEEFYYDLQMAVIYAIKNSGYHAFGFVKKGATKATGQVTIYFDNVLRNSIYISAGTQFHTGDRRKRRIYFVSTTAVRVERGSQSALVPVECLEYGAIGNVSAGEICKLSVGNPNITYISNLQDFNNGKDKETSAERELRFREYVHTLQRGTAEAVAYGIKQVSGVSGVSIDDNYVGFMKAYVHDKDGNLNEDLKRNILLAIENYRSAGIEVIVLPIVKKQVDLNLKIVYREGVNQQLFDGYLHDLIVQYINTLKASQDLNMSTLITVLNDTYRDVIAYIDVLGQGDVKTLDNELLRPGMIMINGENNIVEEGY